MRSSYQQHHKSVLPNSDSLEKNNKHIEMCNKRMRDSNVFRGKFHDTVDNHKTKLESSYKVAIATEKQPLVKMNKAESYVFYPTG